MGRYKTANNVFGITKTNGANITDLIREPRQVSYLEIDSIYSQLNFEKGGLRF